MKFLFFVISLWLLGCEPDPQIILTQQKWQQYKQQFCAEDENWQVISRFCNNYVWYVVDKDTAVALDKSKGLVLLVSENYFEYRAYYGSTDIQLKKFSLFGTYLKNPYTNYRSFTYNLSQGLNLFICSNLCQSCHQKNEFNRQLADFKHNVTLLSCKELHKWADQPTIVDSLTFGQIKLVNKSSKHRLILK